MTLEAFISGKFKYFTTRPDCTDKNAVDIKVTLESGNNKYL